MAEEDVKDPMEYIWDKVPKNKEGLIHYLPGDVPYLYNNGFVDTQRYSYLEWKSAFNDCLQSDGSYLVSRNKFMSLKPFRYVGNVFTPFDPKRVREGEWTDDDLKKLFERSVKPSSSISEEIYWNSIKALKKQPGLLTTGGNLIVNEKVKTQLGYLLERFPSPRRRLEKEVHRIREQREVQVRKTAAAHDASGFTSGKLASEDKLEKLAALQSSVSNKKTKQDANPVDAGIDIKKLRKPSRGPIVG